MKLIIGLGNPGTKYINTRHNIGFEAIDALSESYNIDIKKSKFKAFFGEGKIRSNRVLLVKPQTYMNLSGESVAAFASWYKISPENILIIYDDVSLPIGQIRIRTKGSAGGHNGIKSIIQNLGRDDFERIKIGINEKPAGWDLANYVLSKFTEDERIELDKTIKDVTKATEMIITKGIQEAMNVYNSKTRG